MEIKGRIIHVMPLQSGIGQVSGKEWKNRNMYWRRRSSIRVKFVFK